MANSRAARLAPVVEMAERDEREAALADLEENLQRLQASQRQQEEVREQQRRLVQDESRREGELKARLSAGQAKAEQLALRRRRLGLRMGVAGRGDHRQEHDVSLAALECPCVAALELTPYQLAC